MSRDEPHETEQNLLLYCTDQWQQPPICLLFSFKWASQLPSLHSFSLHCYLISHDIEKIKYVVFEVTLYLKLHPEILSPLKFIYANKA